MRRRFLQHASRLALVVLAFCAMTPYPHAQTYPAKSVRVIVPQSSGSASDMVARLIGQRMSSMTGQPFVVENRPGAGGLTGTELAAKAAPDGYTLMIASISSHGTVPALYRKLTFDPVKDFAPVSLWVTIPNVLVVHPSLPVRSTKELIALAKARPGQLNVGTQGNGSSQHLATELFKMMAGDLNTVHVPYKGSGPAIIGLITGEVSFLFPTLALSTPHINAGKVRAIAVTTLERIEELPQLPPVSEAVPGFEMASWIGLLATAGSPGAAVARLNEASVKALAVPEIRKTLAASGMRAASSTPEQFGSFIEKEIARWTKVARAAKIQAD
ncbi:MAG: Bug family tripartite tricarboxylate transporter substrate binding protein [Burkholderiales bacterium]